MAITSRIRQVERFETLYGAQIFQIPLLLFPGMWGFCYFVQVCDGKEEYRILIDTGSGFGEANQLLEAGLKAVSEQLQRPIELDNLTHILITHGHIDHFGGLTHIRPRSQALIGVHELDLRNLTNYEERVIVVSRRLDAYLIEAGVPDDRRRDLSEMYRFTKSLYASVPVDFTYEAEGMKLGPFRMLHTPGHSAGHVVIRLEDVLFSGDHVLYDISPHQSPESLTASTGLTHYLHSLCMLKGWASGIRLTLCGHKAPIEDLPDRIDAIRDLHRQRLVEVLRLFREPRTVCSVADQLFGEAHGYNALLAVEEAGAHVEYLYQRGLLGIENLRELTGNSAPVPIRYQCLPCAAGNNLETLFLIR